MLGLLALLDEYADPIAFDLIRLGLRLRDLGTDRLTWDDLLVIAQQGDRTSALFRAMHPDEHSWGLPELLLAEVTDALNVANWQRGGGKKADYPKPLPRPGVVESEKKYGAKAIPIDDMADFLGWN